MELKLEYLSLIVIMLTFYLPASRTDIFSKSHRRKKSEFFFDAINLQQLKTAALSPSSSVQASRNNSHKQIYRSLRHLLSSQVKQVQSLTMLPPFSIQNHSDISELQSHSSGSSFEKLQRLLQQQHNQQLNNSLQRSRRDVSVISRSERSPERRYTSTTEVPDRSERPDRSEKSDRSEKYDRSHAGILHSACPARTEWEKLRKAKDANNTEYEIFQPRPGSSKGSQWFYTVTCRNREGLSSATPIRDCPKCCIGVDHTRFTSECIQNYSFVYALVRPLNEQYKTTSGYLTTSHPSNSFVWKWILIPSSCNCAVTLT